MDFNGASQPGEESTTNSVQRLLSISSVYNNSCEYGGNHQDLAGSTSCRRNNPDVRPDGLFGHGGVLDL